MKVCSKCKVEKDFCEFTNRSNVKDGKGSSCRKCENERIKKYKMKNREKVLSRSKEYYKEYKIKNREKELSRMKEYYIKNKEKMLSISKEYIKNRRLNDPIFKLIHNVRCRLNQYLKTTGIIKNKRTFDIVGCSPPELKDYLEKKFTEGMSWDRIGKEIHIDHIIPLSSVKTEKEIYKLCHYTNLQPLWAEDNLKKSNKILKLI
jgi:hypothetical protein